MYKLEYYPAELRKGHRWQIVFYQECTVTHEMLRFRRTFNLNRTKDLILREKVYLQKVREVNNQLAIGMPYVDMRESRVASAQQRKLINIPILEALALAETIKCNTDRKRTIDVVQSMCRIFTEFVKKDGLKKLKINQLTRKHAIAFLDYGLVDRKIGPRTYNNYIERMKAILNELVEREYLKVNPFTKMKKKKITGKERRAFSEEERQIVGAYIEQKDKWLWLGILLQYHCFIRPIEQRRMRVHMINLKEGVIRLPPKVTKNKEAAIITIPNTILPYLKDFGFEKFNQRCLLFGAWGQPNATKCCGHNTYNGRHKQVLEKFFDSGVLADIKGLSYYSWKDTGAIELFKKKVNILEIMRQLRHKDLSTTQKYCNSLYVMNYEIKHLDNPILRVTKI